MVHTSGTALLKDTHDRVFGSQDVSEKFSFEKARTYRNKELGGKNYDIITSVNNQVTLNKNGKKFII